MLSAGELAEYPRCARTVALSTVCFVYACAVRDTHVFSTGVNETWRALCRFKSECRQKQSDFRQSDSAFVRLNCGARIAASSYVPRNGDVVRAPRDFVARVSLPWTSRRLKESAASGCRVDEASLQLRSLTSSTLCSGGVVRCRPTYDDVDKVAVSLSLPRPPCDPTSRAAKPTVGRCCRHVVNRLPGSALRYASCCVAGRFVSVGLFSCRCLFSFSY